MSHPTKGRYRPAESVCLRVTVIGILLGTVMIGCAGFSAEPIEGNRIRDRASEQMKSGVRVSAAVLSAEQTEAVFGLPLYHKGIQPVWLEIENTSEHRMWLAAASVDRDYFSPLEVAYMHRSGYSKAARQEMDRYFHEATIRTAIEARAVESGFIFTHLELGTKAFNVDVLGEDGMLRTFTFLIPVAGLQVDHREVDWTGLYAGTDRIAIDGSQSLKTSLEKLPCCATGVDGPMADPVNVVIIGQGRDVLYALLRSGWEETAAASTYDPMAQLPWEFRYQPVKPLVLFDRPQDAAFRKSRSTLNERNQLRLWLSPYAYRGTPVWVGQISRIVRRSVLHPFTIEPDVDEARTYLLQDLWYAQALRKYGYVRVSEVATIAEPRQSLNEDSYFTDGLCLVVWISSDPVSFSDVQVEPWERPVVERRQLLLGR